MTRAEERRAQHPEVDWRDTTTHLVDGDDVHVKAGRRSRRAEHAAGIPVCCCGCSAVAHDMDTGECERCGCEMLWEVP